MAILHWGLVLGSLQATGMWLPGDLKGRRAGCSLSAYGLCAFLAEIVQKVEAVPTGWRCQTVGEREITAVFGAADVWVSACPAELPDTKPPDGSVWSHSSFKCENKPGQQPWFWLYCDYHFLLCGLGIAFTYLFSFCHDITHLNSWGYLSLKNAAKSPVSGWKTT